VNRGLSPWIKGFSQSFIDGAEAMFTLRLRRLSHMETATGGLESLA
jgi:hypothetical protein